MLPHWGHMRFIHPLNSRELISLAQKIGTPSVTKKKDTETKAMIGKSDTVEDGALSINFIVHHFLDFCLNMDGMNGYVHGPKPYFA